MDILGTKQLRVYQKNWFIWLMLFLFFPIGLFLLWKYCTYQKKAKLIITAVIVLFVVVVSATQNNNQKAQPAQSINESTQNSTETMQEPKKLPAYKVANIEQRTPDTFVYQVIINEPANADQLKQIGKAVVLEAEKEGRVHKRIILFNDRKEYIGQGAALGRIEYDGSWPLEYIGKEKDWSKRLTPEEFKLWKQCRTYIEKRKNNKDTDDNDLIKKFAQKNNISEDKLYTILTKQNDWLYK